MLREALRAPYRSDDAVGTLIVGGVLTLLSIVFVPGWALLLLADPIVGTAATPIALAPWFVLRGYYLRVLSEGIEGATASPSFVRWGRLVRDGVKSIVLTLAYLVPAGFLLALAGVALLVAEDVGIDPEAVGPTVADTAIETVAIDESAVAVAILVIGLAFLAYVLVYLYARPAAEAVLAETGRLRSAISPGEVGSTAIDGRFAGAWLYSILVAIFGGAIAIATIPAIVGIFLLFSVRVSITFLLGYGAADMLGPPPRTEAATESPTTPTELSDVGVPVEGRDSPIDRAPRNPDRTPDGSTRTRDGLTPRQETARRDGRSPEPKRAIDVPVATGEPEVTVQVGRSVPDDPDQPSTERAADGPDEEADESDDDRDIVETQSDVDDDRDGFEWGVEDGGDDETSDRSA